MLAREGVVGVDEVLGLVRRHIEARVCARLGQVFGGELADIVRRAHETPHHVGGQVRGENPPALEGEHIVDKDGKAPARDLVGPRCSTVGGFPVALHHRVGLGIHPHDLSFSEVLVPRMVMECKDPGEPARGAMRFEKVRLRPGPIRELPGKLFDIQTIMREAGGLARPRRPFPSEGEGAP